MTEIPSNSDLVWQAEMNKGSIERTPVSNTQRDIINTSRSTESVYGARPASSRQQYSIVTLTLAAKLVDDAFRELLFPNVD